jgi:hypothetical protein
MHEKSVNHQDYDASASTRRSSHAFRRILRHSINKNIPRRPKMLIKIRRRTRQKQILRLRAQRHRQIRNLVLGDPVQHNAAPFARVRRRRIPGLVVVGRELRVGYFGHDADVGPGMGVVEAFLHGCAGVVDDLSLCQYGVYCKRGDTTVRFPRMPSAVRIRWST